MPNENVFSHVTWIASFKVCKCRINFSGPCKSVRQSSLLSLPCLGRFLDNYEKQSARTEGLCHNLPQNIIKIKPVWYPIAREVRDKHFNNTEPCKAKWLLYIYH
jgi:hypothetical protein